MTETANTGPYAIRHRWYDRVVHQATKATTAADALSAGETVEPTYQWTAADRFEWALCWVGPVVAIIAALWLIGMVVAQVFR